MIQSPAVNRLVTIADGTGREFPSRIEDITDGTLVLARPLDLPAEHDFELGGPVLLSWPDPTGIIRATTELVDVRAEGSVGLWEVRVLGDYQRDQRREFVRVPASGPVELSSIEDGEPDGAPLARLAGQLVRISEASIRCAVPRADAAQLRPDSPVQVDFEFRGQRFSLPASVLRPEPCRHDPETVELILLLRIDQDSADALRRLVFAEQLRLRNGTG